MKIKFLFLILIALFMSGCIDNQANDYTASNNPFKLINSSNNTKEEMIIEPGAAFKYKLNETNWSIEPLDDQINKEVVLLTIDDAPDEYALQMAETLHELDADAIFFVNGHFLETEKEKETLKEIHDLGFMIGNHTYSHNSLPDLTEKEQTKEIIQVNEMVEDIIEEKPKFFRAPFGANTDHTEQVVDEEGMTLMNWSYGYDWNEDYMTKEAITEVMLNADELGNGSNLLMHDREWTAEALHDIVTGLREQGFEIIDPKAIQH